MSTQRQTYLENAFLSAAAVLLLLTTAGHCAALSDDLHATAAPALPESSLTTQLNNSSMEEPLVQRSHRSCRAEHESYCGNGAECMYPQDNEEPSCICTSSYSGPRCLFLNDRSRSMPDLEQLIGICFGVAMVIVFLAILLYCLAYKRMADGEPNSKVYKVSATHKICTI